MKQWILAFSLFMAVTSKANDSLSIAINRSIFHTGDSIEFSCSLPYYQQMGLAAITLNAWIEDLETHKIWKYRYPVLNGKLNAALVVGDSIRPGKYAINFILQRGLFKLNGMLRNNYSHNSLNYLMMLKGKRSIFNNIELSPTGAFTLKNILFEDQSFILFSPAKKVKRNDLFISISTPLDSMFSPIATFTQLIEVNPEQIKTKPEPTIAYKFNFETAYTNTTLPDVIVKTKVKKLVEQYNETYSTGLFKDGDAKVFDGLESEDITNSIDIPSFLRARIPGLIVNNDNTMRWREQPVVVYVDEFRMDEEDPIYVNPSEVAMIKVFEPPASMINGGTSFGGAIAIYTKRGAFENNQSRRYKFMINGYTALESTWR
jgi:hypothetical protein